MAAEEIFTGDVVLFTLSVSDPETGLPVDLTAFDSVTIAFAETRGLAAFVGAATLTVPGSCTYTTTPGQLAAAGTWRAQVRGLVGGLVYNHSSLFSFDVAQSL